MLLIGLSRNVDVSQSRCLVFEGTWLLGRLARRVGLLCFAYHGVKSSSSSRKEDSRKGVSCEEENKGEAAQKSV